MEKYTSRMCCIGDSRCMSRQARPAKWRSTYLREECFGTAWQARVGPLERACQRTESASMKAGCLRELTSTGIAPRELVRLRVPAQPVDATPSSALIRQCLPGRTICLAVLGQNLARAAFRLASP